MVRESSGILLQVAAALLEKLILLEEAQTADFMGVQDMEQLLKPHLPILTEWAHSQEGSRNRRNRSQNSVYLRKLLLLLKNYRN